MNFVSYRQMIEDVRSWSCALPDDLVAVAGVPRSGLLVASLLALHRNIHLVSLDDVRQGRQPWRETLRRGVPGRERGSVLIVDDSINSGGTLHNLWQELRPMGRFLYGALYYGDDNASIADFVCRQVPSPRCFEWNLFHCRHMSSACLDFDGVLCEDWIGREEDAGAGLARYLEHLASAKPWHLPQSFAVLAIVTSRLEKYRPQTEGWLRRHGVAYQELVMSPHPSATTRRAARDNGSRKAAFYASRPDATLFVESDPGQSREIVVATGKPVLCASTMELFGG